jgi:hypothetical protein
LATGDAAIKGRLRDAVGRSGHTLEEIAEITGEGHRNVRNWVSGPTRVPARFVARLSFALPVDCTWILTGEGTPDVLRPDLGTLVLKVVQAAGGIGSRGRRVEEEGQRRLRRALRALERE